MKNDKYILDDKGNVIPEPDLMKWAAWFEGSKGKRVVKQTDVGDKMVSTVFLSLDHNFGEDGPPILWETLVFNLKKRESGDGERYSSKEEALAGHERWVKITEEQNGRS